MMRRVLTIARAVFLDSIRRRILLVVLVFAGIMVAFIPALPDYGLGVQAAVYGEIALAVTFATAAVVVVGLAVTRIPSEIERRTVYSVLARPVPRWEYLCGTWLGTFATAGMLIAAFTVVDQIVALVTYGQPMWLLWLGAAAIWLEMGVIAAFAHSVSTIVSPITAVVASIAFLFIGHSRSTLLGEEGALALRAFYPSLDAFNIVAPVTHGTGVPPIYLLSMVVVFIGFVGLLLALGALLMGSRDL